VTFFKKKEEDSSQKNNIQNKMSEDLVKNIKFADQFCLLDGEISTKRFLIKRKR
jgi:hypothetical protein